MNKCQEFLYCSSVSVVAVDVLFSSNDVLEDLDADRSGNLAVLEALEDVFGSWWPAEEQQQSEVEWHSWDYCCFGVECTGIDKIWQLKCPNAIKVTLKNSMEWQNILARAKQLARYTPGTFEKYLVEEGCPSWCVQRVCSPACSTKERTQKSCWECWQSWWVWPQARMDKCLIPPSQPSSDKSNLIGSEIWLWTLLVYLPSWKAQFFHLQLRTLILFICQSWCVFILLVFRDFSVFRVQLYMGRRQKVYSSCSGQKHSPAWS